jgi:hypothetical protein
MSAQDLDELNEALGIVTVDLLGPLRMSKTLDRSALSRLTTIVRDIGKEVDEEPVVSKALVGRLWFVFTAMLAEAGHARDPAGRREIEAAAWDVAEQLRRIFGPKF